MTAPNELSFLPDDYLEQKYKRRANIICGVLIALTAGAVSFRYSYTRGHNATVEATFAEVDAKYMDAARKIEQVKRMHEQQREVVHHAELAASLVEKVPRSNILAEITNALPVGVSLIDFNLHAAPQATAISAPVNPYAQKPAQTDAMGLGTKPLQYDVHLRITGIAQNDVQVAQLMTRLGHNKLFADVNLVISDTYTDQQQTQSKDNVKEQLRKWQIEMSLSPNAEVREEKTAAVEITK